MSDLNRTCAECGTAYVAVRAHSEFCSAKCRSAFNNRRNIRGAALYDLYMANRYERDAAYAAGVQTKMARLTEAWRKEDQDRRAGRRSWGDWKAFLLDNPWINYVSRTYDGTGRRKA